MRTIPVLVLLAAGLVLPVAPASAEDLDDAKALALEVSGELLAPAELVAAIEADLALIRAEQPFLEKITANLDWIPGAVLLELDKASMAEYRAGTFQGFKDLDAVYGPVVSESAIGTIDWVLRTFEAPYHPERLAELYEAAPGVLRGTPDHLGGMSQTDIEVESSGRYVFRYGWGDCPAGCIHNHYWRYAVEPPGAPALLAEWGDDLVPVEPTTWGRVKRLFGPAR